MWFSVCHIIVEEFWHSSLHCCFSYLRFVLICLDTDVSRSCTAIQSGFFFSPPAIRFAIVLETIILLRDPFLAKLKQLYKWPHISLWNTLVYMQDAQMLCCKTSPPLHHRVPLLVWRVCADLCLVCTKHGTVHSQTSQLWSLFLYKRYYSRRWSSDVTYKAVLSWYVLFREKRGFFSPWPFHGQTLGLIILTILNIFQIYLENNNLFHNTMILFKLFGHGLRSLPRSISSKNCFSNIDIDVFPL